MKRLILAFCTLVVLVAPAMATDYYIVHGQDRHCRVVETMPEDRAIIRVGPLSFGDRDEAERQLKVVCRDNGYYREEERQKERQEERRDDRVNDR